MQFHRLRRRAAAAVLVALVATGCTRQSGGAEAQGDAGTTAGPGASGAPTNSPATSTTAAGGGTTRSSGASGGGSGGAGETANDLSDGRHAARIVAVDDDHKTVRFDVVQFLQGAEAEKASQEDGAGEAYDYYIRNTSKKLRTLGTAPSLTVVINVLAAEETGSSTKDTKITLAKLASYPTSRLADAIFWLTVSHDSITRIEEQYLP